MGKDQLQLLRVSLKKGDLSVLDAIYRENRLPFIKFASRFDVTDEDVLDVYQDAIIALRDNVVNGTLQQLNCSIRTYLFSIGKFMIYKTYKAKTKMKLAEEDLTIDVEPYVFTDQYDATDVLQQKIDAHFESLGDKCQELLKLFYYHGLNLKEIQAHFNYDNYNVVKSQKSRCLKTLKALINKHQNDG